MIIAGSGGSISLSIPVLGSRSNKLPYNQIEIDHRSSWQQDHFRTLMTVYGNSPFFIHYRDELEALFMQKTALLAEWNLTCLNWLLIKLRLNDQVAFVGSSSFEGTDAMELNNLFTPSNYLNHEPVLKYNQVFQDRTGFIPNLSTLDMLFNVGPETGNLIRRFSMKSRYP